MAEGTAPDSDVVEARTAPSPIYVDLARFRNFRLLNQMLVQSSIAMAVCGALASVLLLAGEHDYAMPAIGGAIGTAMVAALCVLASVITRLEWQRERWRVAHVLANGDRLTHVEAVTALLVDMTGLIPPGLRQPVRPEHATEFQRKLTGLGFPHTPTIVDQLLRNTIEKIEIPEEFFEPERVLSQPRRWSAFTLLAMVVIPFYSLTLLGPGLLEGDPMKILFGGFFLLLMGVPALRSFGWRIGESLSPVVSLGAVEDRRGRRWTVLDSCLFVRKAKMQRNVVLVDLAGPAGFLTMGFWGVDDAGFVLLWQRWMHPHPRPELR